MENLNKPLANFGHLIADIEYITGHDQCVMCNKAIRGKSKYMVHACDGGLDQICSNDDHDYVEQNDRGDMGFWSVGSTCVKKLQLDLLEQGFNPMDYIYEPRKQVGVK